MSKRRRLVEFLMAAGTVGAMAHLLIVFAPQASADEASEEGPASSPSDPTDYEPSNTPQEGGDWTVPEEPTTQDTDEPPPPRDFFKLYPAGEGKAAQTYEELDAAEKEGVDAAALWAETGNGHAVHSRWAGVSRQARKLANAKRAQKLSGTQGLDELGVK